MANSIDDSRQELLVLLSTIRKGDDRSFRRLLPLVYDELHRRARGLMANERTDHTLQTTALVHEAYLKLIQSAGGWADESHFFRTAAEIMRHILVDHARSKSSKKRGGGQRTELSESIADAEPSAPDVIDIDQAVQKLKVQDPRRAEVVTLKYFGGLGEKEIAQILGLTERTVRRDWLAARLWLHQEIQNCAG